MSTIGSRKRLRDLDENCPYLSKYDTCIFFLKDSDDFLHLISFFLVSVTIFWNTLCICHSFNPPILPPLNSVHNGVRETQLPSKK